MSWTTAGRLRTDAVAVVLVAPKVSITTQAKRAATTNVVCYCWGSLLQIEANWGRLIVYPNDFSTFTL